MTEIDFSAAEESDEENSPQLQNGTTMETSPSPPSLDISGAEGDLPPPLPARMTAKDPTASQTSRKKKFLAVAAVVLSVAILVTVLGVTLSGGKRNNDGQAAAKSGQQQPRQPATEVTTNKTQPSSPSAPEVPSPSSAPAVPRLSAINSFLVEQGVSSREDLEYIGTPQQRAVKWIAETDGLQLPVPEKDLEEMVVNDAYNFTARYAAAVMHYATNGTTHWMSNAEFLTDKPTCEWSSSFLGDVFGVLCDDELGVPDQIHLSK